jgi:endonuclease YncB( thermonuclease family)
MAPSVWGRRRGFRWPPRIILIGLLALVTAGVGVARLQPTGPALVGRATAIDGDTLRLGSVRVRVRGLDAPELDQTCTRPDGTNWSCGVDAKQQLAARLKSGPIECARHGRDVYGRTLATCTAGGADLGAEIVGSGWAVSDGAYVSEASEARLQQLGIWSGTFAQPVDWRRSHGNDQPGIWEWIRSWFQ